jgi:hypothetical protein
MRGGILRAMTDQASVRLEMKQDGETKVGDSSFRRSSVCQTTSKIKDTLSV